MPSDPKNTENSTGSSGVTNEPNACIEEGGGKKRKRMEDSNLWNHLKDCKSSHFFPIKHMLNGETEKGDIRDVKTWKFDNEVARKGLAHMIVIDELPFCYVEKEGFRTYIDLITPLGYQLPSKRTLTKDIFELYIELRCIKAASRSGGIGQWLATPLLLPSLPVTSSPGVAASSLRRAATAIEVRGGVVGRLKKAMVNGEDEEEAS
nr:zinc finger BED domain-containing protein RICESLEEPER 2-like [Ipomoea batatas]